MNKVSGSCDIILHIGAPKTGSSALQHFLFNNKEVLLHKGFYYPSHGFDVNDISGGHSGMGAALIGQDVDKARQIFDNYKLHAAKKGKVLLISAESLYNFPKKIKQLCSEDDEVQVLSFFRDPVESLVSGYNQSVKRHYFTGSLGGFCQSTLDRGNRSVSGEVLFDWSGEFGSENVLVAGYQKPVKAESALERYFLSLLGIEESEYDEFVFTVKPINRAYNVVALEFKRCLNNILDQQRKSDNQSVDFLLQKISDEQSSQFGHIAPYLNDSTQISLNECFAETTRNVCDELLQPDSNVQSNMVFSSDVLIGVDELTAVAKKIDERQAEVGGYIRSCLSVANQQLPTQNNTGELNMLNSIYKSLI